MSPMSTVMKEVPGDQTPLSTSDGLERSPLPVPYGWFWVSYSEDLKAGEHRNIECFGQEWVLFRAETGEAGVVDPYCPHLGAHLGHGGKVVGDSLRCPFHHWSYNTKGFCTKIPYAKVMPPITKRQAILKALPITENNGIKASTTDCSPPIIIDSVAFLAPMSPPDTGASTLFTPFLAAA